MKSYYLIAAFSLLTVFGLNAQKHSLGFRSGSGVVSGAEISYQNRLNDLNRIQLDLGLGSRKGVDAFRISGLYQWVEDLPQLSPGFNWHYGFGAGIGFVDYDEVRYIGNNYGSTILSLDGMVGIEYSFIKEADIPIQLGLDFKPSIQFFNSYFDIYDLDLALSIRWQFN